MCPQSPARTSVLLSLCVRRDSASTQTDVRAWLFVCVCTCVMIDGRRGSDADAWRWRVSVSCLCGGSGQRNPEQPNRSPNQTRKLAVLPTALCGLRRVRVETVAGSDRRSSLHLLSRSHDRCIAIDTRPVSYAAPTRYGQTNTQRQSESRTRRNVQRDDFPNATRSTR